MAKGTRMESARAQYDEKLSQEREELMKGKEMDLSEEIHVGAVSVQITNFTQGEALSSPSSMIQLGSIACSFPLETA